MEVGDEDDVKLLKVLAGLVADFKALLPKILWKPDHGKNGGPRRLHSVARDLDVTRAALKVCSTFLVG